MTERLISVITIGALSLGLLGSGTAPADEVDDEGAERCISITRIDRTEWRQKWASSTEVREPVLAAQRPGDRRTFGIA